ncbi:MAG: hypothetical protein GOVbin2371_16 [Prokaryotic dsDNA virus sp.]|nr:hypothetical protein [Salipiger sp.]QDP47431.1 MAG: hypothetical protein GOVbin2371_16 [Prokaryotic dsDNA virus sp.]|tara:strand:+ start:2464 stop:2724 length:261 start_codon:yes stop_codon:yes gene_type:complete
MTMVSTVSDHSVAMAIQHGFLSLQEIVRLLAAERIDEDEGSLLVEFSNIGQSLAGAAWAPALHPFGAALDALAATHHEQLLKGDEA